MISFLLVTGPPFDAPLWTPVLERIRSQEHHATAATMLNGGDGSLESEAANLAEQIRKANGKVVLVAHGTAIPAAIKACQEAAPAGLVLSNGPLTETDLFTRALIRWAHLPKTITETLFSPERSINFLASSVGLRRLVVNPYVMDHDTTVMVCGPIFQSNDRLGRMRNYLRTLESDPYPNIPEGIPTLLCWGDADPISNWNNITFNNEDSPLIERNPVPGGRYLHPVERPWELADRCIHWVENSLTTT